MTNLCEVAIKRRLSYVYAYSKYKNLTSYTLHSKQTIQLIVYFIFCKNNSASHRERPNNMIYILKQLFAYFNVIIVVSQPDKILAREKVPYSIVRFYRTV
jgi:hypothetical protein